MRAVVTRSLRPHQRRRGIRLAYINGAIWALGNGLASTSLVIYLALELGARGSAIGYILAAPALVGALRWWASALIGRLVDRKRFCVGCYVASGLLLLALPVLSAPGTLSTTQTSLVALVVLWCLYHLLEYLGTIALWSWLADLVPRRIRGRFIGRRERWLLAGRIPSMLAAGLFAYYWREAHPRNEWWIGYTIPAALGALMMIAAVAPLMRMPSISAPAMLPIRGRLTAPLADVRFWRLLAFGCWFSFFNGVTQSAQNIYPARVLEFTLLVMLTLRIGMRFGQLGLAPRVGRLADFVGNRPVMIFSQAVVAMGLAFFLLATPQSPWWLIGAFVVWAAYAGLNVCLPNLMLKLSPGGDNATYIAFYFAVTGIFYGLSTIGGGWLFDVLEQRSPFSVAGVTLDHFQLLFWIGLVARSLAVVLLFQIVEPGAWTWRELIAGRRSTEKET